MGTAESVVSALMCLAAGGGAACMYSGLNMHAFWLFVAAALCGVVCEVLAYVGGNTARERQ